MVNPGTPRPAPLFGPCGYFFTNVSLRTSLKRKEKCYSGQFLVVFYRLRGPCLSLGFSLFLVKLNLDPLVDPPTAAEPLAASYK